MERSELYALLQGAGFRYLKNANQNIMACCPNHAESRPSWGISVLEPHRHGCFACGFRGTLFSLLLFLKYPINDVKTLCNTPEAYSKQLRIVEEVEKHLPIDDNVLWHFNAHYRSLSYLLKRGISLKVACAVRPLYDSLKQRVVFLWWLDGALIGCTGRTLIDDPQKIEAYGGMLKSCIMYAPTRTLKYKTLILVEGEIDALKVWSAGFENVAALGFGNLSREQKKLLINSGVEKLVIFTDEDRRGHELREKIDRMFSGVIAVRHAQCCEGRKDPGEMSYAEIQHAIIRAHKNTDWLKIKVASI